MEEVRKTYSRAEIAQTYAYWRRRILWSVWITYAAFYLTRINISVAIPGIAAEFGVSKTAIGGVLTTLFAVYAIGQFLNGQLGDKFGARTWVTLGLLASGIINLAFGFTNGVLLGMMLLWGVNGFFQSMGWAPSVKTIANWFPRERRGKIGGLMGTSYQIGSVASWGLSGFIVGSLGWRWAFWLPAIIVIVMAIRYFIRGRNAPEEVGLPTIEDEKQKDIKVEIQRDEHIGFRQTIKTVLTNDKIWFIAFGLFFLNIVRYGFLGWAPSYLFEEQGATISQAAYKALAIPLAGSLGAILSGWISDKYLGSQRAGIASVMLFLLGLGCILFVYIPASNWIVGLAILIMIGFMTYGPHVLMVGTMPMDFATRKAASSAAGFIDGFGYIGASLTGIGTGFLIDKFSWNAALWFWVIAAFASAAMMSVPWSKERIESMSNDK